MIRSGLLVVGCLWGLVTSIVAATEQPAAGDWPQWRGPNRDGKSTESGLLRSWPEGGPALLWKTTGVGMGYSTVSVSQGRLFTAGADETTEFVVALDANTGHRLWKTDTGPKYRSNRGAGPRGTPTVDGEWVYMLGGDGDLLCASVKDGTKRWQLNVTAKFDGDPGRWGTSESVLIEGNLVILCAGGKDTVFLALDKKTGEKVWVSEGLRDRAAYSSAVAVAVGDLRQAINFTHTAARGVSVKDGTPLWSYERLANGIANCPTPVIHDNYVFLTSDYDTGCALLELTADGKAREVYFSEELQNHHGGVILIDGKIYGHSGGNDESTHNFVCMDFQTGKVLWKNKDLGKCSIVYADGHLYALTQDGIMNLVKVNPQKLEIESRFTFKTYTRFRTGGLDDGDEKPTWAPPVVAGRKLYLRDQDQLYCYDIATR